MKKLLLLILALVLCFATFVACSDKNQGEKNTEAPTEAPTTTLDEALSYIHQLYKDMKTDTVASYDLVKLVEIGEEKFEVVWTIEGTDKVTIADKDDNSVTVVVPELGNDVINYTLKVSITKDGKTVSREYTHSVPKFAVNTFADYAAAEDDTAIIVEGIVSGVISKTTGSTANGLYIQDINGEGGYYVYNLTEDPHGIYEVGMKVQVSGVKDTYNGTYELVQASVKVLDSNKTEVTPVDYTELYKNAASVDAASLIEKQGMLVTIKGVTVGEVGDNGYYYFSLGELQTYLRISSSNNPTTKEALETIKAKFAENYGNLADVTGVISIYSGKFYLSPVSADAFANFTEPDRNDAQKAEFELNSIKFDSKLTSDKSLDLAATGNKYPDVSIVWSILEGAEHATIADGKLTVKIPDNEATLKIKAVATCGTETKEAEWTITLSKTLTSIKDAIDLGSTYTMNNYTPDKYLVGGVITEIQSDKYGNVIISDGFNSILVYGLYNASGDTIYDALEVKPAVGDYIVVLGVVGMYNEPQIKNGWIVTHITPTTISDAAAIGAAAADYTSEKYVVTGKITEFSGASGTTYGNVYIQDADGNKILVYGLYSATGATRYDKMETKPEVGDTITVLGSLGNYNGTAQFKNAWLIGYASGTAEPECEHTETEHKEVAATCTEKGKSYDVCKSCEAELNVTEISALGHDFSDATCEDPKKCTREGCNYTEGDPAGHSWQPATCTTPKTCEVCGKTDGNALGHNLEYVSDETQHWQKCKNCEYTGDKENHAKAEGSDVCTVCGHGCEHANTTHHKVDATCTAPGREYDVCNDCNSELNSTVIQPIPHSLKEATCTAPKSCENCDYTEGNYLGHDEEILAAVAKTCTTDGLTEGKRCKRCQEVLIAQTTVPAGHDWAEATCTAPKTCSACNMTEGSALGHNMVDDTCTRCGLVWTTVAGIADLEDGTKVVVTGLVKVINTEWSSQYNNITVTIYDDSDNSLRVYRLATNVTRGDTITVTGEIETYNGAKQIKAGATATVDSHTDLPIEYTSMTIPEILAAADNTYVTFTGTVVSIKDAWSTTYNNMSVYVCDDNGNQIYIFRTSTQVSLCQKVTVKGIKTSYNNSPQIAQGAEITIGSEKNHIVTQKCMESASCPCGEQTLAAIGSHIDADGDGACDRCEFIISGEVIPANLTFTDVVNNASSDSYMSSNYSEWTISGKLGTGYGGYLGFGRGGGDQESSISTQISVESALTITAVLKGNGGNTDTTSTLTFSLTDESGATIATYGPIIPMEGVDTTYTIDFTFVEGKSWSDVAKIVISFNKGTGNIGMKSLTFAKA